MATLSTPERRMPSEDRLLAARSPHNLSSPSASRQQTPSQLTIEVALAAANNDPAVALETVLAERNMLSSQNIQLWKLIEKQRSVHGSVIKELERTKADRDRALAKLDPERASKNGHANRTSSPNTTNPSPSFASVDSASPQSTLPNGHRPVIRHQSDDASLISSRSSATPATPLASSRSHEPLRLSNKGDIPAQVVEADTSTLSLVNGTTFQTDIASATPPARAESLPLPSTSTPSSALTQPLNVNKAQQQQTTTTNSTLTPVAKRHSSLQYAPLQKNLSTSSSLNMPPESNRTLARDSRISLPDEARRYIVNMQESPLTSPRQATFTNVKHNERIVEEPSPISEEEHLQPPESKGLGIYDASHVSTGPGRSPSESKAPGSPQGSEPLNDNVVEDKPSAFLDLEEDGDDDEDGDDSTDTRNDEPATAKPHTSSTFSPQSSTSSHLQPNEPNMTQVMAQHRPRPTVVTRIPSPYMHELSPSDAEMLSASTSAFSSETTRSNSPLIGSQSISPPTALRVQYPTSAQAQVQAQRAAYAQAQAQQETVAHMQQTQLPPSYPNSTKIFGVLAGRTRLLEGDLHRCAVRVTGSNIRANERGKEVLSFVVQVSPSGVPDAPDSWKVEKLYSDVLALDARVRSQLSRGGLKRLGSLPDNKLFKDNAPAKVDQRKAILENYFMTVVIAQLKDRRDVCEFFSSDIINEANAPVTQSGYKEGYLTKRGKNFGGWKTRYFMLQGPVLEYYESRGGAHLGSITITGAQIGRQQKAATSGSSEDENEYRHAFLIIENKKGAGSQFTRHVLCAESDQERDSWVDVLVRYVMGSYDDTGAIPTSSSAASGPGPISTSVTLAQSRPSTSSQTSIEVTPSKRIARGGVVPISQLAPDPSNSKSFSSAPLSDSSSVSPQDRYPSSFAPERSLHPINEVPLSSSLPTHLDVGGQGGLLSQRAASELGHYPEVRDTRSPVAYMDPRVPPRPERLNTRSSMHPSLSTVQSSPTLVASNSPLSSSIDRAPSPDPNSLTPTDGSSKVKISGPLNGTPIPAGYKFGAKDAPVESTSSADRDRKAKSRNFWGFGRGDKAHPTNNGGTGSTPPRAVFAVPIADALNVAQIANLPAVVFRCIQYLEAKKADQEEGIYRLSGSSAVIKSLKDRFNSEGDVDLLASDEFWDPHAIAGLLKSFLRELPTSILTRDLHLKFLAVIDLADSQERVNELAQLISQLPLPNYSLLRALTAHLILIVQNASINKMTMRNVGIVFSPTLGIPAGVFSLMLGEFNKVFNVDDDAATADPDPDVGQRRASMRIQNHRNSRSYADADADRMLGLVGRSLKAPGGEESDSADDITLPDSGSGTETETEDVDVTATVGDSAPRERANSASQAQNSIENKGTPRKAANVAATRGLHVLTDRRRSGLPGLPHSPRPQGKMTTPPPGPPLMGEIPPTH